VVQVALAAADREMEIAEEAVAVAATLAAMAEEIPYYAPPAALPEELLITRAHLKPI
jgi:hypothetical protein